MKKTKGWVDMCRHRPASQQESHPTKRGTWGQHNKFEMGKIPDGTWRPFKTILEER